MWYLFFKKTSIFCLNPVQLYLFVYLTLFVEVPFYTCLESHCKVCDYLVQSLAAFTWHWICATVAEVIQTLSSVLYTQQRQCMLQNTVGEKQRLRGPLETADSSVSVYVTCNKTEKLYQVWHLLDFSWMFWALRSETGPHGCIVWGWHTEWCPDLCCTDLQLLGKISLVRIINL